MYIKHKNECSIESDTSYVQVYKRMQSIVHYNGNLKE